MEKTKCKDIDRLSRFIFLAGGEVAGEVPETARLDKDWEKLATANNVLMAYSGSFRGLNNILNGLGVFAGSHDKIKAAIQSADTNKYFSADGGPPSGCTDIVVDKGKIEFRQNALENNRIVSKKIGQFLLPIPERVWQSVQKKPQYENIIHLQGTPSAADIARVGKMNAEALGKSAASRLPKEVLSGDSELVRDGTAYIIRSVRGDGKIMMTGAQFHKTSKAKEITIYEYLKNAEPSVRRAVWDGKKYAYSDDGSQVFFKHGAEQYRVYANAPEVATAPVGAREDDPRFKNAVEITNDMLSELAHFMREVYPKKKAGSDKVAFDRASQTAYSLTQLKTESGWIIVNRGRDPQSRNNLLITSPDKSTVIVVRGNNIKISSGPDEFIRISGKSAGNPGVAERIAPVLVQELASNIKEPPREPLGRPFPRDGSGGAIDEL